MNRLRELRKSRKLTLKDTVEKLKVQNSLLITADTLAKYERGDREPKIETWRKLANFFNVSVPYLQGLTYSINDMVEVIHSVYFLYILEEKKKKQSNSAISDINTYVRMTTGDVSPIEMYKTKSKTFPLTNKMRSYWIRNFGNILKKPEFQNLTKENSGDINPKEIIWLLFIAEVRKQLNELKASRSLTSLGALYRSQFDSEQTLHSRLIEGIQYFDLTSAKEIVNEYAELINDLAKQVNNFKDDDKYISQYFNKLVSEQYESIKSKNNSSELAFKKKTIIDEIVKRVDEGNKELRNFMVNHATSNSQSFIDNYRNYKVKKGEDVSTVNNYIHQESHIIKDIFNFIKRNS